MLNKIKRIFLTILVFIISIVLADIIKEELTVTPEDNLNDKIFDSANRINKNLPMMVNKNTELISVAGINNTFRYTFRLVNDSVSEINIKKFYTNQKPQIKNYYCTSGDFIDLRKKGVSLEYFYNDMNFNEVTKIRVFPNDCS